MSDRTTDRRYLAYQYGDSERLRIRIEAHERYSERPDTVDGGWQELYRARLRLAPGQTLVDVGCGFGSFHPVLTEGGATVVGFDLSAGMAGEAQARRRRDGLRATIVQADAQAIPFMDNTFDAALASHMLFHVPDMRLALSEIRRVVRVGGRVMLTTNASDHTAILHQLHAQAARDVGFTATVRSGFERFSLDELPLVRSVFPNAVVERWPNAFLFPTVEAVLRFYASGRVDSIDERQADGSHRPPLLARMAELIGPIVERDGVFRVPKDAGCFMATVE